MRRNKMMRTNTTRTGTRSDRNGSQTRGDRSLLLSLAVTAAVGVMGQQAGAALITHANSNTNLNTTTSWTGAVIPIAWDVAQWNNTSSAANNTSSLGGNLGFAGLKVTDTQGSVTLNGNVLTVGTYGIDLSSVNNSNNNLTINSALTITGGASVGNTGAQIWNVASGRTLTLGGAFTRTAGNFLNIQGAGTVATSTISNNSAGIIGTWATHGTGSSTKYATVDTGNIVGLTGTAAADGSALTDTTGLVNYELAAGGGAVPATVSANTIRYSGGAGTLAPGATSFTVNSILNAGSGKLTVGTNKLTIGANRELAVYTANNDVEISGNIANNVAGASSLVKGGAHTLTLSNAGKTYTGGTTVLEGTLTTTADSILASTGAVQLGGGLPGVNATLNMGGNQTIASLNSAINNATGTVNIASGKTLTVNGAVTLGHGGTGNNGTVAAPTNASTFNFTGGGNLVVTASSNFQVGGSGTTSNTNASTVDLSGLTSFTATLPSNVFRVGDSSNTSAAGGASGSTLTLAPTSTITANLLGIGDAEGGLGATAGDEAGTTSTLYLGSTLNTLNVNTISVGNTLSLATKSGVIDFVTGAPSTAKVIVRSSTNATGVTDLNIAVPLGSTNGKLISGKILLAGHYADLSLDDIIMAKRTATGIGGATALLNFDTGSLNATSVVMAERSGTTTGTSHTATINIGGGTASLGAVTMAVNTSSGANVSTALANLNISGGTVTASSINMADAASGGAAKTSSSTISLTGGGSLTMAGDITRTGGGGTENTTLTLNGGTLDMGHFSIGDATKTIGSGAGALNFQAGTLKNVAEINGGAAISKTTSGTLTILGTNSYTGATNVNAGTLLVNGVLGNTAVSVAADATLGGTGGTIAGTVNATGTSGHLANISPGASVGTLTVNNTVTFGDYSNLAIELSGDSIDLLNTTGLNLSSGNDYLTVDVSGIQTANRYVFATYAGSLGGNIFDNVTINGWSGASIDYSTVVGEIAVVAVPEPTAIGLAFGMTSLGLLARRRQAKI
jgi:autotransporter-associated beta strand protein